MATKWISTLTGTEMDSALTDMAYHNSEAYAVGTRNGVAVGSSDVTYHNNAKYYAEQTGADVQAAEAAAARAEAAVPAGTAGAVFFDRAQSLTTAQQGQARANIMAGGSNENLLDNAYFVGGGSQLGDGIFPINQRGQAQYEGGAGIDRWSSDSQITLTASGITISANAIYQNQSKQFFDGILGKTVTYSILTTGGEIKSATIQFPSFYPQSVTVQEIYNDGASSIGYALFPAGNGQAIRIIGAPVAAAKIELGTVSTLANDAPPDFGKELAKCQQYLFIRDYVQTDIIGSGLSVSSTFGIINVTLPVAMRSGGNPTGTFTVSPLVYGGGTGEQPSFALNTIVGNTAKFVASMTAGIANNAIVAYAGANTRITISNEL